MEKMLHGKNTLYLMNYEPYTCIAAPRFLPFDGINRLEQIFAVLMRGLCYDTVGVKSALKACQSKHPEEMCSSFHSGSVKVEQKPILFGNQSVFISLR